MANTPYLTDDDIEMIEALDYDEAAWADCPRCGSVGAMHVDDFLSGDQCIACDRRDRDDYFASLGV